MNGLLVNSYHSFNSCSPKLEYEEPEPVTRSRKSHYYTWPRRRKFSKKRQVSQIIHQIKWERAISEINLKFDHVEGNHNFLNYNNREKNVISEQNARLQRKVPETDVARNRVVQNDCKKENFFSRNAIHYCNSPNDHSDENIFDKNKLGIIRILKNWKLAKDSNGKGYGGNEVEFCDSRSSVSSISTIENDSTSICSDGSCSIFRASKHNEHQNKVISSSHLIQLPRPESLPAKPVSEQQKHQREYEKMVRDRMSKEREEDLLLKKRQEDRLKEEERLTQATHVWLTEILPNWDQMKNSKKTQNLWGNGLPPRVRGRVWSLSIGNNLNITQEKYFECVKKSKEILKTGSKDSLHVHESHEHSVELIRLDISRTFPHLCIFQQGGPYYEILHSLLGAYVCYQPEIGYVQGMSFIAAVLLLNMEELDAFICFSNMLNRPCHKAFYSLDVQKMRSYYLAYTDLLRVNTYDLYKHFNETSLSPDLYLVDWIYTLFSKSMNLDLACRIWDLIARDGENFIFRAALGIMHLSKNELLKMDFLHAAQYLTKLPEDLCADRLFKSISYIRMNNGLFTFDDLLENYVELLS